MVKEATNLTIERLKKLQWSKIFHMFYIEPVVFVLVFAHSLSGTIMKNQLIYQACTVVFNYNETDCQQLGTNNVSDYGNQIETTVQPYVANLMMIRTLLESIVPAICGVFIGSWSDHYGRKPLLLISMIGFSFTYVITAIICELSKYYVINPWYYIIAVVPHSVLGGNCVFSVAAFCFLSDITTKKTRPYRMIFIEGFFFVGLTTGSLLSSFVYAATSATITFGISGLSMCITTVMIALYFPESLHLKHEDDDNDVGVEDDDKKANANEDKEKGKNDSTKEATKHNNLPVIIATTEKQLSARKKDVEKETTPETGTLKTETAATQTDKKAEAEHANQTQDDTKKTASLFSYVHIKDMLNTCFKQRPYNDRCIIWLATGVMFLSIFVIDGAMTVFYLYVREKFHWTVRDFSFYETVSHMVPMLGALLGFLILRKVFNLSVVMLAVLAMVSEVLSSIVRGVASEPWHLYLSVALGVFRSIGGPMCRTMVSNIVPATDLGKIFSIKNVLQSIAPFLAAPLYTFIYMKSITTFPGLFNIVSAALYFIAFIFLIIVLRLKYAHKEHYAKILK